MKKKELLVPAGNMECLRAAVRNGCDSVYLACKSFGARKFATNFTNEEIVEAIHFCHLYGVRVFVTMNTLVKNSEVDSFLEQIRFLHQNGVDAVIVQDFGMICYLREKFPNLEIHASTQANISSKEVCRLYHKLGVKRVVFSRELSIDEIDSIDVPIEKEVFIHGALCISYSGCCLMSSMLGGRSGNRGECAGCCRMPYSLEKNGKVISTSSYLLSTKELNTSKYFERLKNSSIDSFKIEGRMKGPLYVGFITHLYRRLLDGEEVNLEEETKKLKTIFNREFTKGRLFGEMDKDFMNSKSPNHVGYSIGKVLSVTKQKIEIKINKGESLHQGDAIRFLNHKDGFVVNYLYDKKGKLISSSSDICFVDNKVGLEENDIVSKTQDYLLGLEYENILPKRIPISFHVYAKVQEKLSVSISDGIHSFSLFGKVVEEAIKAPIDKQDIKKQLGKLGDSPFVLDCFSIEMDSSIFIPVRELNEIRRALCQELIEARERVSNNFVENEVSFIRNKAASLKEISFSGFVRNEEQLKTCLELGFQRIYTSDKNLFSKYQDYSSVIYSFERCRFDYSKDITSRNQISDYGDYSSLKETFFGSYFLNITNVYSGYYLRKLGIQNIPISVELKEAEVSEFIDLYLKKFGSANFEIYSYGLVEDMIIKGNILGIERDVFEYHLIDSKNRRFPVYYDGEKTHILNHESCGITPSVLFPSSTFYFDFYLESSSDIERIIKPFLSKKMV